jgi:hypothetical protein
MLVWGGYQNGTTPLNTGGIYDPVADAWSPITTTDAPSPRVIGVAVWTGTQMLVWGGTAPPACTALTSGGRYDPVANTWLPISTTNAPPGYGQSRGVWTGNRMVVGGGEGCMGVLPGNEGGIYDPVADSWVLTSTAGAPSNRVQPAMVWTGKHVIIWSGANPAGGFRDDGFLLDPIANSWSPITMTGAPSSRTYMGYGTWTGTQMVIWGGRTPSISEYLNTGGVYTPP